MYRYDSYTDKFIKVDGTTTTNKPVLIDEFGNAVELQPIQQKQDILDYLDNVLHPIVSPQNWNVYSDLYDMVLSLTSAQPDNKVNLCDSCRFTYPSCPSETQDVIFGNGIGNDNICACSKYEPLKQKNTTDELIQCKDCEYYQINHRWCELHDGRFKPTDFCSYAERGQSG